MPHGQHDRGFFTNPLQQLLFHKFQNAILNIDSLDKLIPIPDGQECVGTNETMESMIQENGIHQEQDQRPKPEDRSGLSTTASADDVL